MRVTQNMLNNTMMRNLNNSLNRMDKLQNMMSSGKKISKPSDDPVIASRGMLYRTSIGENEQFKENTGAANDWLTETETAVSEGRDVLARVKELVTQASNDTLGQGDREKIRDEMMQLRDHLGTVANTTLNGRYLFSGTDTDKAPFNNGVYTNQNTQDMNLEVSQGIYLPMNVNGVQLFGQSDTGVSKLPIVNPSSSGQYQAQVKYNDSWKTNLMDTMSKLIDDLKPSAYATDESARLLAADANGNPIYDPATGKAKLYKDGSGDSILKKEAYMADQYGHLLAADANGAPLYNPTTGEAVLYDPNLAGPNYKVFKNDAFVRNGNGQLLAADASGNPVFDASGKAQPYVPGTSVGVLKFNPNVPLSLDQNGAVVAAADPAAKTPLTAPSVDTDPKKGSYFSDYLGPIQKHIDNFLQVQSQIGSHMNRLQLIQDRLDAQNGNLQNMMSNGEDADMAQVIMDLQNNENVHKAALAAGSRIIQPTLLDFLR